MKSNEYNQNKKALNIRKILLTFVDIEIKNKKKNHQLVLINSMNPNDLELENIIQINQEPINTSTNTFTNITEKHLIKRIVDKKNNINYFYSDNLGIKNGMLILTKKQNNFVIKLCPKNLKMDIGMALNHNNYNNYDYNNKKESPKKPKDYIHLYSFNLFKKDIGENKIKNKIQSKENLIEENNISNKQEKYFEEKNNLKIISIKYLVNYCYTHINKQLDFKSVEKNNNIHLVNENYEEKINNNLITKKNKDGKSKEKIYKTKYSINNIGNKEPKKIFTNKSSKNNCFINKFKKYLENNKMKLPQKCDSTKKINRNIPKSNKNNNFHGIIIEDKDSKIKKDKTKIKKNSNSKSTYEFSSPESINKYEYIQLKKHDFLFYYNFGNNV